MRKIVCSLLLAGFLCQAAVATTPLKWPQNNWPELSAILASNAISPDWRGPDGQSIIGLQMNYGSEEKAVALLKRSKSFKTWTAEQKGRLLSMAISLDRQVMVRTLLSMGVSPNGYSATSDSPLMEAAFEGRLEVMRLLIKAGAEVNWGHPLNPGEPQQVSAIHIALSQGAYLATRLLVDAGVNLDKYRANELHDSLIELAISGGSYPTITFLIEQGFDLKQRRDDGHTPLSYAVLYGASFHTVQNLLHGGTDPCIADADGRLPEEIARQKDFKYDRPMLYMDLLDDACKRYKASKW